MFRVRIDLNRSMRNMILDLVSDLGFSLPKGKKKTLSNISKKKDFLHKLLERGFYEKVNALFNLKKGILVFPF